MADNSQPGGVGDIYATDDIGGVKHQRVKVEFGADGSATDVSPAAPLPVTMPDITATGTITATDAVVAAPAGAGATVSGTSTASSYVFVAMSGGDSAWNVQITGLTSGSLYFEGSLDSTNGINGQWVAVNGRQTGIVNTVLGYVATTNGVFRGNTSGLKYFRVRSVGALTGTPAIVINISDGTGAIFLNASIPAGSNNIGNTGLVNTSGGARVTAARELFITDSDRLKQAVAIATTGKSTVTAAADAATAGRWWLINPVGSSILIEVRRLEFVTAPIAATAFVTSPRVTVERVTFTGTASAGLITPAQRDSTDTALVGSLRSASTGLTLTAGAVAYAFTVVPILTAVGAAMPTLQEWEPAENGRIVLRAGQGIVIRQADAGTVSDTRAFQVNLAWAEYTIAP